MKMSDRFSRGEGSITNGLYQIGQSIEVRNFIITYYKFVNFVVDVELCFWVL